MWNKSVQLTVATFSWRVRTILSIKPRILQLNIVMWPSEFQTILTNNTNLLTVISKTFFRPLLVKLRSITVSVKQLLNLNPSLILHSRGTLKWVRWTLLRELFKTFILKKRSCIRIVCRQLMCNMLEDTVMWRKVHSERIWNLD